MTAILERRVREMRARVLVRAWEYRQRDRARGVWFRLRRVLAEAGAAFAVAPEDASALVAEGYRLEPVGQALEPPKTILFVPADRVACVATARPVPLRLGPELLEAAHLVLTPLG